MRLLQRRHKPKRPFNQRQKQQRLRKGLFQKILKTTSIFVCISQVKNQNTLVFTKQTAKRTTKWTVSQLQIHGNGTEAAGITLAWMERCWNQPLLQMAILWTSKECSLVQAGATKVVNGTMHSLVEKYSVATGRKSVAYGMHSTIMVWCTLTNGAEAIS